MVVSVETASGYYDTFDTFSTDLIQKLQRTEMRSESVKVGTSCAHVIRINVVSLLMLLDNVKTSLCMSSNKQHVINQTWQR